jgi:hypothetical protein
MTQPTVSTQYANETIAQMIQQHKMTHSRDVLPPAELQQKFKSDFAGAYDVEWETSGDIYEVEFDIRFKDYKGYYDKKGDLLMYTQEIRGSGLPAIVKNAATSKYPGYRFEDLKKIQRGSEIFYKMEMERGDTEIELLMKSDGTIINEKLD